MPHFGSTVLFLFLYSSYWNINYIQIHLKLIKYAYLNRNPASAFGLKHRVPRRSKILLRYATEIEKMTESHKHCI